MSDLPGLISAPNIEMSVGNEQFTLRAARNRDYDRQPGVLENRPEAAGTLALDPLRVTHAETDQRLVELWPRGRGP
jgi:hypothetical protein